MRVEVVIPAFDEEQSITNVIHAIPKDFVSRIIVVDNHSNDRTAERATEAGAQVVYEPVRGYGQACLRGIEEAKNADIIVFVDADFSDDPSELLSVLEPVANDRADLCIGSRILGNREPGALPIHAAFGNILSCFLIHRLFGIRFTDLGPFRAIRKSALDTLRMEDRDYGWTVEMQAKAAILGLQCTEVPVSYRRRVGRSKISGTILGSYRAGTKILSTIFRLWWNQNAIGNLE